MVVVVRGTRSGWGAERGGGVLFLDGCWKMLVSTIEARVLEDGGKKEFSETIL